MSTLVLINRIMVIDTDPQTTRAKIEIRAGRLARHGDPVHRPKFALCYLEILGSCIA
jgi:hypothetical protein